MAEDGTWGDHVILHGAANYFKTYIHVISSLSHHNDVIIEPECVVASSNQLVLGHVYELHYVSLIPSTPGKGVSHCGKRTVCQLKCCVFMILKTGACFKLALIVIKWGKKIAKSNHKRKK